MAHGYNKIYLGVYVQEYTHMAKLVEGMWGR